MCQATILWVQLRERGQEKEIKLDAAAFCCHARWQQGGTVDVSGFLGSFYGTDGEQKKMWKTSAVGNMRGYTHRSLAVTPLAAMHGVRVGGWQALAC